MFPLHMNIYSTKDRDLAIVKQYMAFSLSVLPRWWEKDSRISEDVGDAPTNSSLGLLCTLEIGGSINLSLHKLLSCLLILSSRPFSPLFTTCFHFFCISFSSPGFNECWLGSWGGAILERGCDTENKFPMGGKGCKALDFIPLFGLLTALLDLEDIFGWLKPSTSNGSPTLALKAALVSWYRLKAALFCPKLTHCFIWR